MTCIAPVAAHTCNFQQAPDKAVHSSELHRLHTGQNSSDAEDYVIARKMAVLMDTDYSQHTRENDVAYLRRSQKIPNVKHLQQGCTSKASRSKTRQDDKLGSQGLNVTKSSDSKRKVC